MDNYKRMYFLILMLFPLMQFLFAIFLERSFILVYGFLGTLLLLFYLLIGSIKKFPVYIVLLLMLMFYYLGWDIANNKFITFNSGIISYIFSNLNLHLVTLLLLIENTRFDERFIKSLLLIFKITIVIAFVVSAIQLIVNPFFLMPMDLVEAYFTRGIYNIRRTSIFGYLSPSEVGRSFLPLLSIMIGYILYHKEKINITLLFASIIVIFATNSRWVYLNLVLILLQILIVQGISTKKIFKALLIITLSIIPLYAFIQVIGYDLAAFFQERLTSESAESRFLAFEIFSRFFPDSPWFGTGVHVGDDVRHAIGGRSSQIHIGYLSHLYEFGIVGSFFLFTAWFFILKYFFKVARNSQYYGSLFAFVAFLLANFTLVVYSIYSYGLIVAFIFNKYFNDKEDQYLLT